MAGPIRKAWYLGNTTVRNPKRLKDGLAVLVNSPLHGNVIGRNNESEFAKLLDDAGVIYMQRLRQPTVGGDEPGAAEADVSDMGRKWRAALMQLGFITPSADVLHRLGRDETQFTVTPNGQRLLESLSLPEEQECFARALLAHQIPSPIETFPEPVFSPLRIVLEVIAGLERRSMDPWITVDEMASIVQLVRNINDVDAALNEIDSFRELLGKAEDRRHFTNSYREQVAETLHGQSAGTLQDYADTNFRYLKLTGLFVEDGDRLRFAKHKRTVIQQILDEPWEPVTDHNEYVNKLWNGAELPTDNADKAIAAIRATIELLGEQGAITDTDLIQNWETQDVVALSQMRLRLEDQWHRVQEQRFAEMQADQWEDIVRYLRALQSGGKRGGLIPPDEAPAYFEWAVWRAFLAINSLENAPWDARRFKIDPEFLPVRHAPGNGPDMVFEFEDFVVVVEVTLMRSSRQEAAEGEPVRRHVAQLVDEYEEQGKRVYGLFMANHIDTNTAETFRIGVWYRPNDDSRMALRIVPMTLQQFTDLFETAFRTNNVLNHRIIEELLLRCLADSNADAPEWKRLIGVHVEEMVHRLQQV